MLTPEQQSTLNLVQKLNDEEFGGWFNLCDVAAFIQVESNFRAKAYRWEPRLHEGSWGLMQVLASTAKSLGFDGRPQQMYFPEVGLRYGMRAARQNWDTLKNGFHRDPTLDEWAAAYNAGPGNVLKGLKDAAYVAVWRAAYAHWASLFPPPLTASPKAKKR